MVVIRLARFGKKNHATFRVIVSDKRKDTHGTYLEQVGTYNPQTNPATVEFDSERVKYWLSVGAQPSPTVHNLLVERGLMNVPKLVVARAKKKPAEATATPSAAPSVDQSAEKPAATRPAAETKSAS
ncbi:MAG: 30S ribosomal protein S16 [Candidatus Kerfeldbacteria bacterium]|nr:30S ribosomal protein S16 [Candidatus Kerfeldbacteria bacterium]